MSNKFKNIIGGIIFLLFGFIFIGNLLSTPDSDSHHKEIPEALMNTHLVNTAQSMSVLENGRFATTFDELAIGVPTGGSKAATTNLEYKLDIRSKDLAIIGTKQIAGVPYPIENREGYAFNGATLRLKNGKGSIATVSITCRSQTLGADGTDSAQAPIVEAPGKLRCADGWDKISLPTQRS
jgi:Type IV pilin-like G and H, putative